jgi:hypothetical protein
MIEYSLVRKLAPNAKESRHASFRNRGLATLKAIALIRAVTTIPS